MVASLFKEIKKVFTGDEVEEEKQEGWGFESPMKGDDVGVCGEGLMYRSLQRRDHSATVLDCVYMG